MNAPRVGVATIVVKDNKLLAMKRHRNSQLGPGTWSIPGGKLDLGETTQDCALRELKEETGIEETQAYFWGFSENPKSHWITIYYVVSTEQQPQIMEPTKCEGVCWMSADEFVSQSNLFAPNKKLLLKDSLSFHNAIKQASSGEINFKRGSMKISAMVAMATDRVIGKDGDIPWRGKLKGEQLLFKHYTKGKAVVMGRKTWDSIPDKYKPLPGRTNIVITRDPSQIHPDHLAAGTIVKTSPEQAKEFCLENGVEELVAIGGSAIYEHFLPQCDTLYLTTVEGTFQGDTYFPGISNPGWSISETKRFEADESRPIPYTFSILVRNQEGEV